MHTDLKTIGVCHSLVGVILVFLCSAGLIHATEWAESPARTKAQTEKTQVGMITLHENAIALQEALERVEQGRRIREIGAVSTRNTDQSVTANSAAPHPTDPDPQPTIAPLATRENPPESDPVMVADEVASTQEAAPVGVPVGAKSQQEPPRPQDTLSGSTLGVFAIPTEDPLAGVPGADSPFLVGLAAMTRRSLDTPSPASFDAVAQEPEEIFEIPDSAIGEYEPLDQGDLTVIARLPPVDPVRTPAAEKSEGKRTHYQTLSLKTAHDALSDRNLVAEKTSLTIEDCRRLAQKRNLAVHQANLEALTQKAIVGSRKAQMLPHIVASGELSKRDDFAFAFSEILGREGEGPAVGGNGVNQFSRSRDLGTLRLVLETRWSPTDALLAHYVTESARNDEARNQLIRIRLTQKLLSVVDSSFCRVLCLEKIEPMLVDLVTSRERLNELGTKLFEENLVQIEDFYRITKKFSQARSLANSLRNERELQHQYLASTMNVDPELFSSGKHTLSGDLRVPEAKGIVSDIELEAFRKRPEAFQAGLSHINSQNDLKRTMIRYIPRFTAFGKYTRDIDKHLLHNDWKEYGVNVYFDVVDVLANNSERKAAKHKEEKTRVEIGAIAMGITSQVREARIKLDASVQELEAASSLLDAARRVHDTIKKRVQLGAQDKLSLLESDGDVLLEEISRLRSLGEANARQADLDGAIGRTYEEPFPKVSSR